MNKLLVAQKTVLEAILEWSSDRPAWQRDALRRIIAKGRLDNDDFKELVLLCKIGRGAKVGDLKAVPLEKAHLPANPGQGAAVTLISVADVSGANNLAPGQTLGFESQGLTVIYGNNGAGKSGYRRSLGSGRSPMTQSGGQRVTSPGVPQSASQSQQPLAAPSPTVVATVEHDSKSVLELADSNCDGLLQSMNEQRGRSALWPYAAAALAVLFLVLHNVGQTWPTGIHVGLFVLFVAFVGWVKWRDGVQRLTVLFFEPDAPSSQVFEGLSAATRAAAAANKLRSVANTSQYADTKYTGGASQGLKLDKAEVSLGQAPGVVANIDVPLLRAGRTLLAFYPDRVLAFQGKSVGAIDYRRLEAVSRTAQFIENESVPSDARVIEHTWQYVNKKGGPDKRFKNNRQLPVCAYNAFNLSTPDGVDIRFLASKEGCFDTLAQALGAARRRP